MKRRDIIFFSSIFIIFICIGMDFAHYPQNDCIFESVITKNPGLKNTDISCKTPDLAQNRLININTASEEELSSLPGIDTKLSQRIITFREKYGDFEMIEDIMKISGIGEKKFSNIMDYITVKY